MVPTWWTVAWRRKGFRTGQPGKGLAGRVRLPSECPNRMLTHADPCLPSECPNCMLFLEVGYFDLRPGAKHLRIPRPTRLFGSSGSGGGGV